MTQHPDEGTLHAYVDGELPRVEAEALDAHVAGCASCAAALAEARGLIAAASRTISALDAAPSSVSGAAPTAVASTPTAPRRFARPVVFRASYARAAALLLLAGGTAVVIDRSADRGTQTMPPAESTTASAAPIDDRSASGAAAAPVLESQQVNPMAVAPEREPSTRSVAIAGSAARKVAAPAPAIANAADVNVAPPSSESRARAGNAQSAQVAVTPTAAPPQQTMPAAPPPPTRRVEQAPQAVRLRGAAAGQAVQLTRYRTKEGIVLTLLEEPLRASFAEEVAAAGRVVPQPQPQSSAAPTLATIVNSYRWSSAERGKTYTLSGPLTLADLEALSKRLSELERLP